MPDYLVVGESLMDVLVRPDGTRTEHPGGSPANVAFGLGRLGDDVELVTRLGADDYGRRIGQHLAGAGVSVLPGSTDGGPTSVALAHVSGDGAARYDFELAWELDAALLAHLEISLKAAPPRVLHTGSIGALLAPGAHEVRALVERLRPSTVISYDPNLRPQVIGPAATGAESVADSVAALVAAADVVKVSDEDLAWLHPDRDPSDVAHGWAANGPAIVVLTRGASGALGFTSTGFVAVTAPPVAVADTVGAGDAFMAALLHALCGGPVTGELRTVLRELDEARLASTLEFASAAAAITVSRSGADPPTRAEVAAFLDNQPGLAP